MVSAKIVREKGLNEKNLSGLLNTMLLHLVGGGFTECDRHEGCLLCPLLGHPAALPGEVGWAAAPCPTSLLHCSAL